MAERLHDADSADRDIFVTSFCRPMTCGRSALATRRSGQGEVAGIGFGFRCRRFALLGLWLVALAACPGDDVAPQPPTPTAAVAVVSPVATPAPAPQLARYYQAYLDEVFGGDIDTARAAYREVMATADTRQRVLAARAALRLAAIEAWTGNRREAIELAVRATALGGQDRDLVERADQLQDGIAAIGRPRVGDVRGPPIGTELTTVSVEAREKFARAERLTTAFHAVKVKPRIEDPQAGARARQRAAEVAARAYGAVVDLGEPAATVAAEFRIGSLYHDLAVALVSEAPPELDRRAAARLRRQQKAKAARHLRTARAAYLRSRAIGESAASARWRREAREQQASVDVLLQGSE